MISYDIISLVLPIFALIALGYGASWVRLLSEDAGDALGQFVYVVAIPMLVFRTLATANFESTPPWGLWASYFAGVAVVWGIATLMSHYVFRREARYGVIAGISAGFANTFLVAIPLVSASFGEAGLIPLLLIISIHLPVLTIASTLLIERAAVADGTKEAQPTLKILATVSRNLATNPIVIGIVSGGIWNLAGLPLGGLPAEVIAMMASAAIPVALFSLGMSLRRYGIRGNVVPAIVTSTLKLLVMPAVIFVLANYVFAQPPMWVAVATLTAACPTGINAYVFASSFGTGHAVSSNTITFTTALAVLTIGLWMTILGVV